MNEFNKRILEWNNFMFNNRNINSDIYYMTMDYFRIISRVRKLELGVDDIGLYINELTQKLNNKSTNEDVNTNSKLNRLN